MSFAIILVSFIIVILISLKYPLISLNNITTPPLNHVLILVFSIIFMMTISIFISIYALLYFGPIYLFKGDY
jgi:hypothetical protein